MQVSKPSVLQYETWTSSEAYEAAQCFQFLVDSDVDGLILLSVLLVAPVSS